MDVEIRDHKLGATLRLTIRPASSRTKCLGVHGNALRVAVSAPPEKGKANKELLRWLAKTLNFSRSSIELISGDLSRNKVVLFRAIEADRLASAVKPLLK
jgi:hypothetical protein